MNDTELFELCKNVYERTGWDHVFLSKLETEQARLGLAPPEIVLQARRIGDSIWECPSYTTDYILDKLLAHIPHLHAGWTIEGYRWFTWTDSVKSQSDTPLKALLKLTIALHDAGQLGDAGTQA